MRGRPLSAQNTHMQNVIRTLVVVGVGMILGDGILTPSVSVLSAVEGLSVAIPSVQKGTRAPRQALLPAPRRQSDPPRS